MSWIPACFGLVGALLIYFYPLDDKKQQEVTQALRMRRGEPVPLTA